MVHWELIVESIAVLISKDFETKKRSDDFDVDGFGNPCDNEALLSCKGRTN